jgi:hypothetical protein
VRTRTSVALLSTLLGACGASSAAHEAPADARTPTEGEALQTIREVLAEAGVEVERDVLVDIGHGEPLAADLRFSGRPFGIEWVSAQDRARQGDRLPGPAPGGQLRILPGAGDDEAMEILLLEQSTYEYDASDEHVRRGATGVREVDGRIRRDVRDFLEYVRGHGAR